MVYILVWLTVVNCLFSFCFINVFLAEYILETCEGVLGAVVTTQKTLETA